MCSTARHEISRNNVFGHSSTSVHMLKNEKNEVSCTMGKEYSGQTKRVNHAIA